MQKLLWALSLTFGMAADPLTALFAVKDAAKRQMHVHVYSSPTGSTVIGVADGKWKALSVQFKGGAIEAVEMKHGTPGQLSTQISSKMAGGKSFFQSSDLGGAGLSWPNGLAATVTFQEGTDMGAITIDYGSMNTYVVSPKDPSCVPNQGKAFCLTAPAAFFNSDPPPAVVGLSDTEESSSYDVYVFAEADGIKQVSVGFSSDAVAGWKFANALTPNQVIQGTTDFGIWRTDGKPVPTGVPLTRVVTKKGACDRVANCLDPSHRNSVVEDMSKAARPYSVLFVHGASFSPFNPCESCTYVKGGGDAAACMSTGSSPGTCSAGGSPCFTAAPSCQCDGAGPAGGDSPTPALVSLASLCTASGSACKVGAFECFSGAAACTPVATTCFAGAQVNSPETKATE